MTAFIIEHDSPLSAWGQVQRDLRHRIDVGEFVAGQRIQTEVELIAHYDVSRVTIRRSIRALIDDGYLRTRRGSGTYVTDRTIALVCELDLARPWREQLVIDGRDARSHLIETMTSPLPAEIAHTFGREAPRGPLTFSRTVQMVDTVPIGITESWRTDLWIAPSTAGRGQEAGVGPEVVVAECFAEVGFATALHANLLHSYLDIPLIVVTARTRLAASAEIVEYARTFWLSSRVRLAYTRRLTTAEMDIARLIGLAS